jgi:hypothetical protein
MLAFFADIVLLSHFAFVLFVVGGQIAILLGGWRGWRWVRGWGFRLAHLAAIAVVVAESWLGVICPLTWLEHRLRLAAGQTVEELSFVAYWVREWLFYGGPEWVFGLIYSLFGLLVLSSWWVYPPRKREG